MSKAVKVTYLLEYLKKSIESDPKTRNFNVIGEVSNYTYRNSDFNFFTLKDDKSSINCILSKNIINELDFELKNGDNIIANVQTVLYATQGKLQLRIFKLALDGVGDLNKQFEKIKEKLNQEGLFDQKYKKTISKYPSKLGIITGEGSAAYSDIIKTINNKWPLVNIFFYPSLVQGDSASKNLIEALNYMDTLNLDTIILARGGGSIEDLWAFNDEILARTIFNCKTPIITGVGHEIDTTIADYVSDYRAATPTAAAEYAIPNIDTEKNKVNELNFRINALINNKLSNLFIYTKNIYERPIYTNKKNYFNTYFNRITNANNKLLKYSNQLVNEKAKIDSLKFNITNIIKKKLYEHKLFIENKNIVINHSLINMISENRNNIHKYKLVNTNNINNMLNEKKLLLGYNIDLLDAYSPLNILKKGYNIAFSNNKVIKSVKNINNGDIVKLRLDDGEITAIVKEINYGKI